MIELHKLRSPFLDKDLEWRVSHGGVKNKKPWAIILCYVDARAIMDRLDEVVGPENWRDSYEHMDNGVMCSLSIKYNGEWITKQDGSPETAVEAYKGGISKALVRCAVKWGVGRYLYDTPTTFAHFVDKKTKDTVSAKIEGEWFNWLPPNKSVEKDKPKPKSSFVPSAFLKAIEKLGRTKEDAENLIEKKFEDRSTADEAVLRQWYLELNKGEKK